MSMYITIGVVVLFVVMMLSGKFSITMAGITSVCILLLTKTITLSQAFTPFVHKNIIMMIGMFTLAGQLGRTDLFLNLQEKMLSAKGNTDFKTAFLMFAISCFLAQFLGQTALITIMMAFLTAMGSKGEVTVSRMLIPITFLSTVWMGKLPVGSGMTSFLMPNTFIEAAGGTAFLDMFSFMKVSLVPGILLALYCMFTYKMMPKKDVDLSAYTSRSNNNAVVRLSKKDNICIYVAFVVCMTALVFTQKLGEIAYCIPLIIDIALIYLKVITGKQMLQGLIQGPALMGGSILALSDAITNSGVGDLVGNGILSLLGGHPAPFVLLLTFGIVSVLLTSFVSNSACIYVLVPVACSVCVAAGYDCRAAALVVNICSVMSVLTPMSSNGAALAYSTVGLSTKDTWKWAVPASLIGTLATVINCYLVYPL